MTLRQFLFVLSAVELTSLLVPSYRLRVAELLSSDFRATVESLSSVHSSNTVAAFAGCKCRVGKVQKAFLFPVVKSYSVVPDLTHYFFFIVPFSFAQI